jgi:hypothetical protein
MTTELDLASFQDRLGRELVAAARRRHEASSNAGHRRSRPLAPWPITLAAAAAAIVIVLIGAAVLRPEPAVADIFAIRVVNGAVQLDVVDIVTDPRNVERQLATELGLDAELAAIPAAPEYDGHFLRVEFDSAVAPEVGYEGGSIVTVTLPAGFSGRVRMEYGRAAEPGETYQATNTDPSCAELWASRAGDSLALTAELATTVRYETIAPDYHRDLDVPPEVIDPSYRLVDITYLSSNEVVVTYAASLDAIPRHPNCR